MMERPCFLWSLVVISTCTCPVSSLMTLLRRPLSVQTHSNVLPPFPSTVLYACPSIFPSSLYTNTVSEATRLSFPLCCSSFHRSAHCCRVRRHRRRELSGCIGPNSSSTSSSSCSRSAKSSPFIRRSSRRRRGKGQGQGRGCDEDCWRTGPIAEPAAVSASNTSARVGRGR